MKITGSEKRQIITNIITQLYLSFTHPTHYTTTNTTQINTRQTQHKLKNHATDQRHCCLPCFTGFTYITLFSSYHLYFACSPDAQVVANETGGEMQNQASPSSVLNTVSRLSISPYLCNSHSQRLGR